jgi:hypothetical protein
MPLRSLVAGAALLHADLENVSAVSPKRPDAAAGAKGKLPETPVIARR